MYTHTHKHTYLPILKKFLVYWEPSKQASKHFYMLLWSRLQRVHLDKSKLTPAEWHTIHGGGGKSVCFYWYRSHIASICWISSITFQFKNMVKKKNNTLLFLECYHGSRGQSACGFGVLVKIWRCNLLQVGSYLHSISGLRSAYSLILNIQCAHIILRITVNLIAP